MLAPAVDRRPGPDSRRSHRSLRPRHPGVGRREPAVRTGSDRRGRGPRGGRPGNAAAGAARLGPDRGIHGPNHIRERLGQGQRRRRRQGLRFRDAGKGPDEPGQGRGPRRFGDGGGLRHQQQGGREAAGRDRLEGQAARRRDPAGDMEGQRLRHGLRLRLRVLHGPVRLRRDPRRDRRQQEEGERTGKRAPTREPRHRKQGRRFALCDTLWREALRGS